MTQINADSIAFLKDIRDNNDRKWFATHKQRFQAAQSNIKDFLKSLETTMNQHDHIEKTKLFRIYRDVRFSKDKTPYNTHWSMSLGREKPYLRGGYYVQLNPDGAMLACGFWNPNPGDLAIIRGNIDQDASRMKDAINHRSVKKSFGKMEGKQVKTAPKGYKSSHPDIELIRHKQFIFTKSFGTREVLQPDFADQVSASFKGIRPFFDYMSDILGHNLNGEPLY